VAEGGGLLNRYTVQSRIKGSNPFLSATLCPSVFGWRSHAENERRRVFRKAAARFLRQSGK
jgi:hypothetical protein